MSFHVVVPWTMVPVQPRPRTMVRSTDRLAEGPPETLKLWAAIVFALASVMIVVPVAGLVAAVVVPNRFYTPTFRKVVEWVEYVCLTGIFPLSFWLMGVLAAIRYR